MILAEPNKSVSSPFFFFPYSSVIGNRGKKTHFTYLLLLYSCRYFPFFSAG